MQDTEQYKHETLITGIRILPFGTEFLHLGRKSVWQKICDEQQCIWRLRLRAYEVALPQQHKNFKVLLYLQCQLLREMGFFQLQPSESLTPFNL